MTIKPLAMLAALTLWPVGAAADDQIARQLRLQAEQARQQREAAALVPDGDAATTLRVNGEDFAVADNTEALARALLVAINHGQADDVARLLAQYRRLPEHDATMAAFAQASISRLEGNLPLATQQYAALLAEQPGFVRARLDWARTLFDNRLDAEAKAQFAQLSQAALPAAVHQNIQGYVNALDIRNGWRASMALGPAYTSNVAESAGKTVTTRMQTAWGEIFEFEQSSPPPEAALGLAYDASLSKRWPLAGHHALFAQGVFYGTRYRHHPGRSEDTFNGSAGYQWASARHLVSAAPLWEWGQIDQHKLYQAAGARLTWQYTPRPHIGTSIEAERKNMDYTTQYRHNSGSNSSVYATLSYAPNTRWWLYGGLDAQWRRTQEQPNDYRQYGLRAGAQYQWGNSASLNISASLRHRRYAAYNAFLQAQRQDREQTYSATLKIPRWQTAGFTPALTAKHTRVNSNVDWFAGYRKNEIILKWERFF